MLRELLEKTREGNISATENPTRLPLPAESVRELQIMKRKSEGFFVSLSQECQDRAEVARTRAAQLTAVPKAQPAS